MTPATAEIFKSQLKTVLPEVERFINPRRPNAAVRRTPYKGTPPLVVLARKAGAKPSCDKSIRLALAADSTTVKRTALIMLGRNLTPASPAAITNGDPAALDAHDRRSSLSDGTRRPMKKTENTYKSRVRKNVARIAFGTA